MVLLSSGKLNKAVFIPSCSGQSTEKEISVVIYSSFVYNI